MPDFASSIVAWQKSHGRHDLPWQGTRDPYRVWLSEVMLQQTQVAAVVPYYEKFLQHFPTLERLARARQEEVLRLWSGLGYYARGRNLHRASQKIAFDLKGRFPSSSKALQELPGVGRSTAAAIAVFAFGERAAILDGNVKRVLARYSGIEGWPGERAVEQRLWRLAERLLPNRDIEAYTQGLMDLGATVCARSNPRCEACPLEESCVATKRNRVESIPAPRPRKALPKKRARWFVLVHDGEVLMEKRPPAGLWGGLWSFPETLRYPVLRKRRLPALEHDFTHFRLVALPILCTVKRAPAARVNGDRWMKLADARAAAVPTPVKRLLAASALAPDEPGRRPSRGAAASRGARAAAARRAARSPTR